MCATSCQSLCTIVTNGDVPSAVDHNWYSENIIPSVTLCMNISSDTRDSLYSGGKEGSGCVCVSVHDATFEQSNGPKHSANILRVMRTSIVGTASSCPFTWLVWRQTVAVTITISMFTTSWTFLDYSFWEIWTSSVLLTVVLVFLILIQGRCPCLC